MVDKILELESVANNISANIRYHKRMGNEKRVKKLEKNLKLVSEKIKELLNA